MGFSFYNHVKQNLSFSPQGESVSIGCEAWIDVNRFFATEKSIHQANGNFRSSAVSGSVSGSLTKSFTHLRNKLRRSSPETLD
ncbi:MAG: hypothetical protein Nkreftii_003093 [Candidatus Nitrospira kreftii]|uniref:Uncharacterized protein n=1 Tax=Candidatus Nitrospira kreftii TaxID=2652173 RepID=A0A7S8FGC1_9BACT|nr:MAG: hypothetical protein Nkreftii_003093 [Candidatus Nitrospira kreftii]